MNNQFEAAGRSLETEMEIENNDKSEKPSRMTRDRNRDEERVNRSNGYLLLPIRLFTLSDDRQARKQKLHEIPTILSRKGY